MTQGFGTAFSMNYQPEGYKELIAYQLAFNESMRLYWVLPMLPVEEESLLAAKLVEGSRLVCGYLAEAWDVRRQRGAFVAKLEAAKAKAATMQTWLAFAVECGYVEPDEGAMHCDLYGDVLTEIEQLIRTATVVVNLAAG